MLEILLVEDNDDDAHFIEAALDKQKHNVRRIVNGERAFHYLLNPDAAPDVVLLDYHLPLMDGLEIIGKTRAEGKDYAFLFLTIDNTVETAVKAMKAGALDFLPKTREYYSDLPDMIHKVYNLQNSRKEKKKAEAAARESQERFSLFMDYLPCAVFIKNEESKTQYANQYMKDIVGIKDWIGKTAKERFSKETAGAMIADDKKAMAEGYRSTVETVPHKDGENHIYQTHKFRIDRSGKPPLLGGIAMDVTERVRAEEALRKSEGKLNAMLGSIGDYMSMVDKDLNILWANHAAKEVFGSDIVGGKCYKVFHNRGDPCESSPCLAQKAFEDGQTHTNEARVQRPDGQTMDFARTAAVALRDEAGAPVAVIETSRDITGRKAIEKERQLLERRRRWVEKAESLSRMAGAVAHHFNNMLTAVIGNLELALEDPTAGPGMADDLDGAMQAALRASEMSGLLLTYLGKSAGKQEPLHLSQICGQHLLHARVAMPRDVRLATDFPHPGPVVQADSAQMRQLLAALVANAGEAMEGFTGNVNVSVGVVEASKFREGCRAPAEWAPLAESCACLAVEDAGRGMDAKIFERIFDPFYTDKFTGRGLGLAVALGIVKTHGGGITVASEPGRGSVFRVFLPLSTQSVPAPVDAARIMEIEGGGVLLLVEDDASVRHVTRTLLERLGFEVLTARDGAEAVEIFRENVEVVRLVISDLSMPRLNGWETLTELRKIRPDIPVILASGYDETQVMEEASDERPQAFLHKPFKWGELKAALRRALERK
ncbi:MAG: response regulator [Desulfobacterales bacterium]|nr:response regulator [Desulfobacterales bacterium]